LLVQTNRRLPGYSVRWLGLFAVLALLVVHLSPIVAQKDKGPGPSEEKLAELKGPDTALVSAVGCGYLVLSPNDLLDHPLLKQAPARLRENLQMIERDLPAKMGVRLRQLQRFAVAFPIGPMTGPVGLLNAFKEFDLPTIQKNLGSDWKAAKHENGTLLTSARGNEALLLARPSLLLIGRPQDLESFLERARLNRIDNTLHGGLASAESGAQLVVGLRPDDIAGVMMPYRVIAPPPDIKAVPEKKDPGLGPNLGPGSGPPRGGPGVGPGTPPGPPSGPGLSPGFRGFQMTGGFPGEPLRGFEEPVRLRPPAALGGVPFQPVPPGPGGFPPPGGFQPPSGVGPPGGFPFQPGTAPGGFRGPRGDRPDIERIIPEREALPTMADLLRELPPQALPYKPLFQCKAATLALRLGEDSAALTLRLGYARPEQTEDGSVALKTSLYVLRELLPRLWLDKVGLRKESAVEVVRALDRLLEAMKKTTIQVSGRTVEATATLPLEAATVGILLHELEFELPLAAERSNALKQIGLALHSYHDTYNFFPGTAYYSAQGKPLLSWRVAILPYIEEANLYNQFKLDEPWDSAHNIKLLEKMPKTFAPPPGVKAEPGHTFIQAFSGDQCIFDPDRDRKQERACTGIRIFEITDGTSNTAMIGESGKAVPWTKPEDIPCTAQAVPPLGCIPGSDRCLVLMGDGSVHTITTRPPLAAFRNMVGRNDGNVFDIEDLKPGKARRE
jgi:hypothetical protein